jgi:hypothetical protein
VFSGCDELYCIVLYCIWCFIAHLTYRDLPVRTGHYQEVYVKISNIVNIGRFPPRMTLPSTGVSHGRIDRSQEEPNLVNRERNCHCHPVLGQELLRCTGLVGERVICMNY